MDCPLEIDLQMSVAGLDPLSACQTNGVPAVMATSVSQATLQTHTGHTPVVSLPSFSLLAVFRRYVDVRGRGERIVGSEGFAGRAFIASPKAVSPHDETRLFIRVLPTCTLKAIPEPGMALG